MDDRLRRRGRKRRRRRTGRGNVLFVRGGKEGRREERGKRG